MTRREMFEAIVNGKINDEVIEMVKGEIVKMDDRNAKRRNTISKKAKENEPLKIAIVDLLRAYDEPVIASTVAEKLEISTQKASALLRQIDGLTVTDVKVKGKGKVKGYALAQGATPFQSLKRVSNLLTLFYQS